MIGTYHGRFKLNIRKGAGTSFPVVRTMEPGESVEIVSIEGDWAKVREGFVMVEKLTIEGETHVNPGAVGTPEPIFEKMRVVELREYAAEHGVDLAPGMKKAEIIAALRG